ncbi:MAG: hypothetical protein ACI4O6_10250 [Dysosmobacter sp.]
MRWSTFENQSREFLYLHASALQREEMTPYERCVAGYLRGEARPSQHRIILLDGMDEVSDTRFFDGLPKLLSRLSEPGSNTTVWFGWRTEHYYHQESPDLSRYIENARETASIQGRGERTVAESAESPP